MLHLQPHETLYHALRKRGLSFEVNREFNSPGFFVGAAVTLEVSKGDARQISDAS